MKIEEKKNVFGFMCKLSALWLTLFPMFVSAQEVILPFNTTEVTSEDLDRKPVYAGYPKRVTEQVKSWGEDCVQPVEGLGPFSVSATTQVVFSPGNLQYQASTKTWRFAEHQYDYIGDANKNISASYTGWIDLFGWGTGNAPTKSSTSYSDYSSFTDWGINPISNGGNTANQWRTLTKDEWVYLFNTRSTPSGIRYAKATLELTGGTKVSGVILLPDNWEASYHELVSVNESGANFTTNNFPVSVWLISFEAKGAVFLPASGYRNGTSVHNVGTRGRYWSSTAYNTNYAYNLYFYSSSLNPQYSYYRYYGFAVRLVSGL